MLLNTMFVCSISIMLRQISWYPNIPPSLVSGPGFPMPVKTTPGGLILFLRSIVKALPWVGIPRMIFSLDAPNLTNFLTLKYFCRNYQTYFNNIKKNKKTYAATTFKFLVSHDLSYKGALFSAILSVSQFPGPMQIIRHDVYSIQILVNFRNIYPRFNFVCWRRECCSYLINVNNLFTTFIIV